MLASRTFGNPWCIQVISAAGLPSGVDGANEYGSVMVFTVLELFCDKFVYTKNDFIVEFLVWFRWSCGFM